MRALLAAALVCLTAHNVCAAEGTPWAAFPKPSKTWRAASPAAQQGCIRANGIDMYYAVYGSGDPLLLIHGGLANADIWEDQVKELSARYRVIIADSRGHGRSTRPPRQVLRYRDMADDYAALLAQLGIDKVALVGWSDGAIIGLDMAMRHPLKLSRLFAHAANWDPSGLSGSAGAAWRAYERWAREDYQRLFADRCGRGDRGSFDDLKAAMRPMWSREPRWTTSDLEQINVPSAIVLGEHDEVIRCSHTRSLASAIPDAGMIVLPRVGHFAMRQDPKAYNLAITGFLDGTRPSRVRSCR